MATNYGRIYGRPHMKMGYGKDVGKVKQNIRRKTAKGGLKMNKVRKQLGYGGM